jgi:hypothetical protein
VEERGSLLWSPTDLGSSPGEHLLAVVSGRIWSPFGTLHLISCRIALMVPLSSGSS